MNVHLMRNFFLEGVSILTFLMNEMGRSFVLMKEMFSLFYQTPGSGTVLSVGVLLPV